MINITNTVNTACSQPIQSNTAFKAPENVSEGKPLLGEKHAFDTFELSEEGAQNLLSCPDKITIEIPRAWTISYETSISYGNNLRARLEKADSLNLSGGARLTFLQEEGQKWANDIRKNDPEMFAEYLTSCVHHIREGKPELANLPSDFTMADYYSYVKEPFSVSV